MSIVDGYVRDKITKMFQRHEKNRVTENLSFLLESMDEETYLSLIKSKIETLINQGYTYQEQLDIINSKSGKNISCDVYIEFVKNHIENREIPQEKEERLPEKRNVAPIQREKPSIKPIKKSNPPKFPERKKATFQFEAMPNIDELY